MVLWLRTLGSEMMRERETNSSVETLERWAMTIRQAIWLGIGLGLLGLVLVAWLKGAFGLAGAIARKFSHELGEPWTLGALAEPFGAVIVVFFVAAFGLARPESRWARWFYGHNRMARARERYAASVAPDRTSD